MLTSREGRTSGTPPARGKAAASPAPEKVVVFSQWTRMLDLVAAELAAAHIRFARLDGSMSVPAREAAINTFTVCPLDHSCIQECDFLTAGKPQVPRKPGA